MNFEIPLLPNCTVAWREAVRYVDAQPGHQAFDVAFSIADPVVGLSKSNIRMAIVNDFLVEHAKPLRTVANTIFPQSLYLRYGAPDFFDVFNKQIINKIRKNHRWSGYYFERMTNWPGCDGASHNQLWNIVQRIRSPQVRARNKYELSIFDPNRDVDNSPYGGQCLSHLSFKVVSGDPDILRLTAMYRNHFYIEKLLGNIFGLGLLMAFIAHECDLKIGPLTIQSTHAVIDLPNNTRRNDLIEILDKFDQVELEERVAI